MLLYREVCIQCVRAWIATGLRHERVKPRASHVASRRVRVTMGNRAKH